MTKMVNSSNNQGEVEKSENVPTVPSTDENKEPIVESSFNRSTNTREVTNSLSMESGTPFNSIGEITKEQQVGWLRHGNRIVRFASVKPFEETLSTNATPTDSQESEEVQNNEYSERVEENGQNYYNSDVNYYQNGPIYQQPSFDNRFPIPQQFPPPPPPIVNGLPRPPFNTVGNVPVVQQTAFSQPQIFPGHVNYPAPFQPYPYVMPPITNMTFPTFVGYSCYPTTVVDYSITRRIFNPPFNPVVHVGNNFNSDYQQQQPTPQGMIRPIPQALPQTIPQGIPVALGIPLHPQQNVESNDVHSINTNITNDTSQINVLENTLPNNNSSSLIDDNSPIQQQNHNEEEYLVSRNDTSTEANGRGNNIVSNNSSSINVSQQNVPNRDI